jgi:hypothetical protein
MEPLSIQAGSESRAVRPVLALDSSLTAVLREGRVVAGEVIQSMDGHSVLIGVGRHRVPADAQVDLQPGERFLARVERSGDEIVLRLIGGRGAPESGLVLALRRVVGEDRPVGELLGDVASRLRAALASDADGEPAFARLLRQLGTHVFEPGTDGAGLRRLLARAGLDHEAQLLALAGGGRAVGELNSLLGDLVRRVLARLNGVWSAQGLEPPVTHLEALGSRLLLALSGLRLEPGAEGREAAMLAAQLEARLGGALAAGTGGELRRAALASLPALVAELLGEDGGAPLAALLRALERAGDAGVLSANLKSRLLAALGELPEGAVREAVGRALAGLESEQLLNVARREFHEGWHLSLPVPDGDGWATAHLVYAEPDGGGHEGAHEGEDMHRLTVAVDFSKVGPLRADLGVRDDLVALRLRVTDERVAAALRAEVPALVERLEGGGRQVRVSVAVAPTPEVEVDRLSTNIRWLREHHLMDRSA